MVAPSSLAIVIVPMVSLFSNPDEVNADDPAPTVNAVPYVALPLLAVIVKSFAATVNVPFAYVIL